MIIYDGVNLEELNLFLKESPFNQLGFLPKTVDANVESEYFDGSIDQGLVFGAREFTLDFVLVGDSQDDLESKIELVKQVFWKKSPRPLVVEPNTDRYMMCMLNGEVQEPNTPLSRELSIPMIAPDPFWYSFQIEGGSLPPDIALFNRGNHSAPFELTLTGIATNPRISVNGEIMEYEGTLGASDVLEIDTGKRVAKYNGVNAEYYNRIYPRLKPGPNLLTVSSGEVIVEWRHCWV